MEISLSPTMVKWRPKCQMVWAMAQCFICLRGEWPVSTWAHDLLVYIFLFGYNHTCNNVSIKLVESDTFSRGNRNISPRFVGIFSKRYGAICFREYFRDGTMWNISWNISRIGLRCRAFRVYPVLGIAQKHIPDRVVWLCNNTELSASENPPLAYGGESVFECSIMQRASLARDSHKHPWRVWITNRDRSG